MQTIVSKIVTRRDMTVCYELLEEEGQYGIRVSCDAEAAEIPDLAGEKEAVTELLEAMCRGFVTPVTARDVAEDWLLR